jgi:hypothetical protein
VTEPGALDWDAQYEALRAETKALSERSHHHAAVLSRWSMFWSIALVLIGSLIAAQGGALKAWGESLWLTASFVVLGIVAAVGSGFQAMFKPGERSPKFEAFGLSYRRLYERMEEGRDERIRQAGDSETAQGELMRFVVEMRDERTRLRCEELDLYVAGPPPWAGHAPKPRRTIASVFRRPGQQPSSRSRCDRYKNTD